MVKWGNIATVFYQYICLEGNIYLYNMHHVCFKILLAIYDIIPKVVIKTKLKSCIIKKYYSLV